MRENRIILIAKVIIELTPKGRNTSNSINRTFTRNKG